MHTSTAGTTSFICRIRLQEQKGVLLKIVVILQQLQYLYQDQYVLLYCRFFALMQNRPCMPSTNVAATPTHTARSAAAASFDQVN